MRKAILSKLREALVSVLPITLMVLVLSYTPALSLEPAEYAVFGVSAFLLILGIGLFNLGADMAMTPMGQQVGEGLTKSRNMAVLLAAAFIMGLLITVAEPDLAVLAGQVSAVMNGGVLMGAVGLGVGLFLALAVIKIIFRADLGALLMFFYMLVFALAALLLEEGKGQLLPMAFDSGGVTTGPITVPFIMALGVGIALTAGGRNARENSFGLVALCSVGPVMAVLFLSLTASGSLTYTLGDYDVSARLGWELWKTVGLTAWDVARSLLLILASFGVLQVLVLKLPKKQLIRIAIGAGYTFLGLVIFLSAVNVGFMPIGFKIGSQLARESPNLLVGFGLLLGAVTVLAEPAVHVLNMQVEEITGGEVTKLQMTVAMSVGVGLSIGLSLLREIMGFSVLCYLIPGYALSLGLSFFVPKLYTAIAFDSGGVASGPLTSGFILPLAIGACAALRGADAVLESAFGIVAMVAMTPLITIQTLGFRAMVRRRVREERAMRRILAADDGQIIYFS